MAPWSLSLTSSLWAIVVLAIVAFLTIILFLFRNLAVSQNTKVPKCRPKRTPIHLLVVLGSGGHTAEMFSMLRRMRFNPYLYSYRTYVVSSGDNFSAAKAVEFEKSLQDREDDPISYTVVTVPRARRVHQSYFSAPLSTFQSFWACVRVLCGRYTDQKPLPLCFSPYPDLILANGPATAVCVVLAARFLRLCRRLARQDKKEGEKPVVQDIRLRTIFVESWARVTTLSLSGRLLLPFVDRFLVQWPALEGKSAWWGMRKTEYAGALVD